MTDVMAKYKEKELLVGNGDHLFLLRYEDRHKVETDKDLNATNLFWRLPLPEEDEIEPGNYEQLMPRVELTDYVVEGAEEKIGTVALTHPCGLHLTMPCYHGIRLPVPPLEGKLKWEKKYPAFFALVAMVSQDDDVIKPIIECQMCGNIWVLERDKIVDLPIEKKFKGRL